MSIRCWIGWHTPYALGRFYDGASVHAHCKRCNREIMRDSQGNWFTFKPKSTKIEDQTMEGK